MFFVAREDKQKSCFVSNNEDFRLINSFFLNLYNGNGDECDTVRVSSSTYVLCFIEKNDFFELLV